MLNRICHLFFCVLLTLNFDAVGQTVNARFVDGEVFIKVKDSVEMNLASYDHRNAALNLLFSEYGIDTIHQPFAGLNSTLDKTYRVRFHHIGMVDQLVAAMQQLPFIEYCEKAPLFHSSGGAFTPNDFDQSKQYQLLKIFARDAWGVTEGSPNIVVAIVDCGVRITHSDLAPNVWTNPNPGGVLSQFPNDLHGWDVADNDNNPNPPAYVTNSMPFNHGTHCAGIAAAATNDSKGIASIGFNTSIMAVKCSPDNSTDSGGTLTNAYDGLYYAIQAGADIISMSWGGTGSAFLTGQNIINAGYAKGIVMVAASGNSDTSEAFYPAAFAHVLAVGATSSDDTKARYSNYGSYISVMAPGNNIYSTLAGSDTAYGYNSGTSMACPLVAGLAALVKAHNPVWSADQIMQQIISTCDYIDDKNPTYTNQLGAGRINAALALGVTPTGIAANANIEEALLLSPNPCDGLLHIHWKGKQPLENVSVTDCLGRDVFNQPGFYCLPGSSMDLNLSTTLTPGIYFVKGISAGNVFIDRLMIR